jgi:UV DNA damage repair endonuclease
MYGFDLSNLYNNVIIYKKKKKSSEQFCKCERNVQNFPIHVIRALYIENDKQWSTKNYTEN